MISDIFMDESTLQANVAIQTRAGIDPDALERYRYALEHEREDVPPVVVFQDDDRKYWIGDGHHRCRAQLALNPDVPIRAEVRQGTRLDALKHALKANAKHGLPRTTEDLRTGLTLAETHELIDPADPEAAAEILGCGIRRAEQITRPARTKAKRDRNKRILDLHAEGKTYREIAEILNVSPSTVANVFKKRNVSENEQASQNTGEDLGDTAAGAQEHDESEGVESTGQSDQSDKTVGADTPDERLPLDAYASTPHEPAETEVLSPKPIASDPWGALTDALKTFLASCPEQPTLKQSNSAQRLITEVLDHVNAPIVDNILAKLTSGQSYTAAEAKNAFTEGDLRLLATGQMTAASAEHFLTTAFQA